MPMVELFGNDEQARKTREFLFEAGKCLQAFFGFGNKAGIAFKLAESNRVVDVGDGHSCPLQLLAEEHVFVSVVSETLVERQSEHEPTADEEV